MKLHKLFIFVSLLYSLACYAQQGNYKFNNFGNRSILLSGNVTGSVEDLGLTYYNPSRLTEVENTGFAFNARAYELSSYRLTNVLGEESKVSNTSFNGIPSMAGGTFNLWGTRFAYSFLIKSKTDINLNSSTSQVHDNILNQFPDIELYQANVALNSDTNDDWTGLTWAQNINKKLSLGISVFGTVYDYKDSSNLNHTIQLTDGSVAHIQNTISFKQKSYGIIIKVGANYHFTKFDLGLNLHIPYIDLYDKGNFDYTNLASGTGTGSDYFYNYSFKDLKAKRKEPLGVSIGAGIPIGKSKLHLNIDYVNGLSQYHRIIVPDIDTGENELTPVIFDEKRKSVINFGFGAEVFLKDELKAYLGFSTDYNSYESDASIFDLSNDSTKDISVGEDFTHWSIGIDWKLKWASLVLGTTYTKGESEFLSPFNSSPDDVIDDNATMTDIKYNRWQFVIGVEIPFLNNKFNNIFK